ncbi:MAG: leucine-rich repeat protein [Clostridia bacterium]|nr:leucine-rich repeat protein [Clostridia bacterium]
MAKKRSKFENWVTFGVLWGFFFSIIIAECLTEDRNYYFYFVWLSIFIVGIILAILLTSGFKYIKRKIVVKKINAKDTCLKCGKEVLPQQKFCINCGKEIERSAFSKPYVELDDFLFAYIEESVGDSKLIHKKSAIKLMIARFILALITFLVIAYICLYHENYPLCALIEIIAIFIYIKVASSFSIVNFIKKELKARPDDNMEYIIASAKENALPKRTLKSIIIIPLTLLICLLVFAKPHIIYEKVNGSYLVRYYTLALFNDSVVEIPDEYKGEKVIEIRGKTFYNMKKIKEIKLPRYLTSIRGSAFEGTNIENIVIPENVETIGGSAFRNCKNLSQISLPYGLKEIDGGAFAGCSSLSYIEIPESVISIGGETFQNSGLKDIILPPGITEIRGNTFENTYLSSIVIPDGVTRIGGHAFYGCNNLSAVTVPESVTEIGSSAFRNCGSLNYIKIPAHTDVNERAFKNSPTRIERYTSNEQL